MKYSYPYTFLARPQLEGQSRIGLLPVSYESTVTGLTGTSGAPFSIIKASGGIEAFSYRCQKEAPDIYTLRELELPNHPDQALVSLVDATESWFHPKIVAIGGEHTISPAIITGLRNNTTFNGPSKVIVFDAHEDFRNSYHDVEFSHACTSRLISQIDHMSNRVFIVKEGLRSSDGKNRPYFIRSMDTICGDLLSGEPVYISIDADVFDPSLVDVGNPVPGGLSYVEFWTFINKLVKTCCDIVGFDVVESLPTEKTSTILAVLIRDLITTFWSES